MTPGLAPLFVENPARQTRWNRFRSVPREKREGKLISAHKFILLVALAGGAIATSGFAQTAPAFSKIVVFGDSLSDTGNVRDRTNSKSGGTVQFPSGTFNYSDGRWTNSSDTDPGSPTYVGVWHEQLAHTCLNMPIAA